jgi:hypothetical protein
MAMSIYTPIVRGEFSSEFKLTKDSNKPFVHTQFMCSFAELGESHIRSMFIFPKKDKRGTEYVTMKLIVSTARQAKNDSSRLVAPIERYYHTFRVNPKTGAVTKCSGKTHHGYFQSLDSTMNVDQFKQFLLYEAKLATDLISLCV